MGYLTHKEKSLLFSALTREEKACKENGFEELVPVVKSLEGKFYYDRFEKDIRNEVIDEFADELINHSIYADIGKRNETKMEWVSPVTRIKEVAEQLKRGAK